MTDIIRKCVFPAAGYGTRFLPVTKSMPKEMLPIIDKPLIHYGVEEAYQAGMSDITFVVGRNKEAIVNYFDVNYELENEIKGTSKEEKLAGIRNLLEQCAFSYIRQKHMRGLGDAINCTRYHTERRPFAVLLSDDFCVPAVSKTKNVLESMQEIFVQEQCTILAVQEVPQQDISAYGVVDVEPISDFLYQVKNMVEKPDPQDAPSNLAIIGRYIMMPTIFDHIANTQPGKNGELQITDALARQVQTEKVLAYKIDAQRFDCGSHAGFKDALLAMLEAEPGED